METWEKRRSVNHSLRSLTFNSFRRTFRLKLTKEQITFALPTMDVRNTVLADQCPLEVDFPCQPRKYRAYNGYCNNVQNPRWGNANTRYLRFLPPDYSDGKDTVTC